MKHQHRVVIDVRGALTYRVFALLAAATIALAAVFTIVLVSDASATSGDMSVTTDTTLTEDHTGRITIDADNVTLDCDGHTITGPGRLAGLPGVSMFQRTGVTVKNCVITDFNDAFRVLESDGNHFLNNSVSHLRQGFTLNQSDNNVLDGNTVTDANDFFGVSLGSSHGNTLIGNTVIGSEHGFLVLNSNNNTLTGNTASDNISGVGGRIGGNGFGLTNAHDNVLDANEASDNLSGYSIGASDNNEFRNNTVTGGENGFHIDDSHFNTFTGNAVSDTAAGGGFVLNNASDNTLSANESHRNGAQGFHLFLAASRNIFSDNVAHFNGDVGIRDQTSGSLTAGTANTYSRNVCMRNTNGGSDPTGLCSESGTFSDDDGSVFEFDIEWMAAAGITKGCNPPTNDLFCPDSTVTRGQMAAFLVRALGLTDNGGGDLFIDDDESIFEADIDKMATAGITKGCNPPDNDRFCPDSKVTRGQMAAFLVRALGYTDDGGGNLFIDDDGNVFEGDIDKLGTAGVTKGCNPPTNDRYCPDSAVTRGQMAAFLHRALG